VRIERTAWSGSSYEEENVDLEPWLENADEIQIHKLLEHDFQHDNAEDQEFLKYVFEDSGKEEQFGSEYRYHWGEVEKKEFKKLVSTKRPDYSFNDERQQSFL
jgi:hypothetical protein